MNRYFNLRNRTILGALVRADFKLRYQGSVLGYAWSLLKPLMFFAVLYVIFVYVFPVGRDIEHFPVYLLTGIVLWNFFAESTTQGLVSVVARGDLIRKINIPRYLLIFSSEILALINLGLGLIVLIIFALFSGIMPSTSWLLIFPIIFELFVMTLGISFLLSTFYVKYRDVSYIWDVMLQIGFYASAIVFPLTTATVDVRKWLFINPIVQIVQDARYAVATKTSITLWSTVGWIRDMVPFLIVLGLLIIGAIVFKQHSKRFAEDI